MKSILIIRNRQRIRAVDSRLLRQMIQSLLGDLLRAHQFTLGLHLVAAREMTLLNETFLHHAGSTDIITFNYSDPSFGVPPSGGFASQGRLRAGLQTHGEMFICVDDAVTQARKFRTTWQAELVRYVTHGILHLLGHDDARMADRRRMKRKEDLLVRQLADRFAFSKLAARKPRHRSKS